MSMWPSTPIRRSVPKQIDHRGRGGVGNSIDARQSLARAGVRLRQASGWEPARVAARAEKILATRLAAGELDRAVQLVTVLVRFSVWRHPNQLPCARCATRWQRPRGDAPVDLDHAYTFAGDVAGLDWQRLVVYCAPCLADFRTRVGAWVATMPLKHHSGGRR